MRNATSITRVLRGRGMARNKLKPERAELIDGSVVAAPATAPRDAASGSAVEQFFSRPRVRLVRRREERSSKVLEVLPRLEAEPDEDWCGASVYESISQ